MNQPAEEALRAWFAAAPPTVFATPASWPVPIETFRRIATDTGFLEGPPHDVATLTFHRPFDHPPGPVDEQRARWLANRLGDTDHCWISLREARLGRHNAEQVAARHGWHLARHFGDGTDQVLLFTRQPVTDLRALVAGRRGRPFRTAMYGASACFVLVVLTGVAAAVLGNYTDLRSIVPIVAIAVEIAALAGFLISWYASGRSVRISALAREFTHADAVKIPPTSFQVSDPIATQIAGALGYGLTHRSTHRDSGKPVLHFQRLR